MQQDRFTKAVADLRRWVESPASGRDLSREVGIELVRHAAKVVDSLPDSESGKLLTERAKGYLNGVITNELFQRKCDLARAIVLACWRLVATHTGRLPGVPHEVDVTVTDDVQKAVYEARAVTDESDESPEEPFPCSSRLGRPVEGREEITPSSVLPDLKRFTDRLLAVDVAFDLAGLIYRLERIATFVEGAASPGDDAPWGPLQGIFRRTISYFCRKLNQADSGHQRGSCWLCYSHCCLKDGDDFERTGLFAVRLAFNLKDAGRVTLAAAEDLARRAEDRRARSAPSPPPGADAGAIINGARAGAAEAPEPADLAAARDDSTTAGPVPRTLETTQAAQARPAVEEGAGGGGRTGEAEAPEGRGEAEGARPALSPPVGVQESAVASGRAAAGEAKGRVARAPAQDASAGSRAEARSASGTLLQKEFDDRPLVGERWQIAWALKLAGILNNGTPKELKSRLKNKMTLRHEEAGREQHVFINKTQDADRIQKALDELRHIKTRGRYHPRWILPKREKGYDKHREFLLEARTKEVLAKVLAKYSLLKDATVVCLDETVAAGKTFFGQYHEGLITLYAHDRLPPADVRKAHLLLKSKLKSATPAGVQDQADPPPGRR
jgi:hypothetical protein